jgi:hypothetical protein
MLLAALALHNLEEGIAYPEMRGTITGVLAARGIPLSPAPSTFALALAGLTLGAALLVGWAACGPGTAAKRLALRGFAAVLLVNIVAPHVPAALLLGGYAPGVVTAVAVNLPVGVLAWRLLRGG